MLPKKLAAVIPFGTTIPWYPREDRQRALLKFLVLWVMSLSPLLVAAFMQQVPEEDGMATAFLGKLASSFYARHQFIYAVSFITPIFYFIWERHYSLLIYFLSGKRAISGLKLTPPGFGGVLLWSVFFFMLTTIAFAAAESRAADSEKKTIIESWSDLITVLVYLFGLTCWYFLILDGTSQPVDEYYKEVEEQEKEEERQSRDFSSRISGNEEEA